MQLVSGHITFQTTNNGTRVLFSNIDLFNIQGVCVWMLNGKHKMFNQNRNIIPTLLNISWCYSTYSIPLSLVHMGGGTISTSVIKRSIHRFIYTLDFLFLSNRVFLTFAYTHTRNKNLNWVLTSATFAGIPWSPSVFINYWPVASLNWSGVWFISRMNLNKCHNN